MSGAEKTAWKTLRLMREQRFGRQVPVGPYVVDFYSPRYRLCVEIDGPMHEPEKDKERDQALEELNIFTVRIRDDELLRDTGILVKRIEEACSWKKRLF